MAHVFNRHLDPDLPASLSSATIDGLLRAQLGFEGVVISDDLQMGAITSQFGFDDAIGTRAHDAVMRLVERGDVNRARVIEAQARVRRLRDLSR